jgi:hypothetical protein
LTTRQLFSLIEGCTIIVEFIVVSVTQITPSYLELKITLHWSREHRASTSVGFTLKVRLFLHYYRVEVCHGNYGSTMVLVSFASYFAITDISDESLLVKALTLTCLPLEKIKELYIVDDSDHTPGFYASRPLQKSILWSLDHWEMNLRHLCIQSKKRICGEILDSLEDNTKLRVFEF